MKGSLAVGLCAAGCVAAWQCTRLHGGDAFLNAGIKPETLRVAPASIADGKPAPSLGKRPSARPALSDSLSSFAALSLACSLFAGASIKLKRRQANVRCFGGRRSYINKGMYGGEGPPTTPKYLEKPELRKAKTDTGIPVPDWLTLDWWNKRPNARMRSRSIRYWVQTHDDVGNLAFDPTAEYSIEDAVQIILEMNARSPYKSDQTLECVMRMHLDPRFPDQQIRMSIDLPHGTGKDIKVAVFCSDEDAAEVQAAGAVMWGSELEKAITAEKFEFDILLAKMDQMPKLAKLGRILGPQRLMPSPKSGTVIKDFKEGVADFKKGRIELRHCANMTVGSAVGKLSFGKEKLVENVKALLKGMADKAPAGAKTEYWKSFAVGGARTPSIQIKPSQLPVLEGRKK